MRKETEYKGSAKAFLFGNLEILKRTLIEAPDFEGKSECLRCLRYAFQWEDDIADVEDKNG